MAAPKLIFIAGLPHSGSTLLDMACSSGGLGLSLGEVRKIVKAPVAKSAARDCSCGATGADCVFWGPLIAGFDEKGVAERYRMVLEAAGLFAPDAAFVIDSTKSIEGLRVARPYGPVVLQIVKDARAYICSKIDNAAAKEREKVSVGKELRGWMARNEALRAFAAAQGLSHLTVSYEALCFDTAAQVERINAAVGAPLIDAERMLGSDRHHILAGNRMSRRGPQRLRYDARWMAREEWLWPYALNPAVRRFNRDILATDG